MLDHITTMADDPRFAVRHCSNCRFLIVLGECRICESPKAAEALAWDYSSLPECSEVRGVRSCMFWERGPDA